MSVPTLIVAPHQRSGSRQPGRPAESSFPPRPGNDKETVVNNETLDAAPGLDREMQLLEQAIADLGSKMDLNNLLIRLSCVQRVVAAEIRRRATSDCQKPAA